MNGRTISGIFAWRIPWVEEADRLQCIGLHRVTEQAGMGGLFQLFLGRGGDSQDLGHYPLLGLLSVPWKCQGTSGSVIPLAD